MLQNQDLVESLIDIYTKVEKMEHSIYKKGLEDGIKYKGSCGGNMKNVEVISYFNKEGMPRPYKVRLQENSENIILEIKRVIQRDIKKDGPNKYYEFKCEIIVNGRIKIYKLRFYIDTCKWYIVG